MKKIKSLLVLLCAVVFAMAGLGVPTAKAEVVEGLTVDYLFNGLGEALTYGVVAEEYIQGNHAETSICVDTLIKTNELPFLNTETTYKYGKAYPLYATVSAPADKSLLGMQFALCTANGDALTMYEDTIVTVEEDTNVTAVGWNVDDGSKYLLETLYVRQVEFDGHGGYTIIDEGAENSALLEVHYGSSVSTAAPSSSYIGSMVSDLEYNSPVKFYNTMEHNPPIVLGPGVRMTVRVQVAGTGEWQGQWPNRVWVPERYEYYDVTEGTYPYVNPQNPEWGGNVYIEFTDSDGNKRYERFEDRVYYIYDEDKAKGYIYYVTEDNGTHYHLDITSAPEQAEGQPTKVQSMLQDADRMSIALGNMVGGVVNHDETKGNYGSYDPSILGNSTVTGPEDANGNVVSLYSVTLTTTSEGNYAFDDKALINSIGQQAIMMAPNEYAVINLIVPTKDGTGYVDMLPDSLDLYIPAANVKEQAKWDEGSDTGSSDRVLYNFVYLDETTGTYQPFKGTINPASQHGGTLLAPQAHLDVLGSPPNGASITKSVENKEGTEIHQRTMTSPAQTSWVNMLGDTIVTTGAIKVIKKNGSTMELLDDVEFTVYKDAACTEKLEQDGLTNPAKTGKPHDSNHGFVLFDGLNPGTYYVKETKSKPDYITNDKVYTVKVQAGVTSLVGTKGYVENFKGKGTLELVKAEEGNTSVKLPGAEFALYHCKGKDFKADEATLLGVYTTDANGKIQVRLDASPDYWIVEIKAPFGYELGVAEPKKVEIKKDQTTVVESAAGTGVVTNTKKPLSDLKVTKVDAEDNSIKLQNAEFKVYLDEACKDEVGTFTTDQNGEGTIELPVGTYWVKESKAPQNYNITFEKQQVEIIEGQTALLGTNGVVTNEHVKGEVYVRKVSARWNNQYGGYWEANSAAPLPGAEFTVYNNAACATENIVAVEITDEDGYARFSLKPGQYWVKETRAPAGYEIRTTEKKEFWVNAGDDKRIDGDFNVYQGDLSYNGSFANTRTETGSIELFKGYKEADGSTTPLYGAEFGIYYDQACTQLISKHVTGDFGRQNPDGSYEHKGGFRVPGFTVGQTYYLKELTPPEGYKALPKDTVLSVTIESIGNNRVHYNGESVVYNEKAGETTSVTVKKHWPTSEGIDVSDYLFLCTLDADGKPVKLASQPDDMPVYTTEKTADGDTLHRYTWSDLPKCDDKGNEIKYVVIEEGLEGYFTSYDNGSGGSDSYAGNGGVIVNRIARDFFRISKDVDNYNGAELPTDIAFNFTITPGEKNPGDCELRQVDWEAETETKLTPDETGVYTVSLAANEGSDFGVYFPVVAGTYTFVVQEVVPSPLPDNWAYDTHTYTVTFEVADDGSVEMSQSGEDDDVFTNKYYGTTDLEITKYWEFDTAAMRPVKPETFAQYLTLRYAAYPLDTEDDPVYDHEFSANEWKEYTGITPSVEVDDVIENEWVITYENLPRFIGDKVVTWSVVEKDIPGYTKLYDWDSNAQWAENDITNTLELTSVSVTKEWVGGRQAELNIAEYLTLYADGDKVDLSPACNGNVYTWNELPKYENGKLIAYTVKETTVPDGYTVTYLNEVGEDAGELVPGDFAQDGGKIVNTYAAKGAIVLEGTKVLKGRTLAAGEFSFELKDANGNVLQTKKNAQDGSIVFDEIEYTEADLSKSPIKYTISEMKDSEIGMTYAANVAEVIVTLTDNGDGTIKAEADKSKDEIKFVNTYAVDGKLILQASKSLSGSTLKDGQFEFTLTGEGENQTVQNNGSAVVFAAIEYDEGDIGKTFTYTVAEKAGNAPGYKYDETKYTVVVKVEMKDGKLVPEYTVDGETGKAMTFKNAYEAKGAIVLEGEKVLKGRTLAAGEFSFELKDANGNVLQTKKNAQDGSIVFDEIEYTEADLSKSPIKYTISEVKDSEIGMTYAANVAEVIVTLTDNGEGTIKAEADKSKDEIKFVNTYAVDGKLILQASKSLSGSTLKDGQFEFALTGEGENQTVKNNGSAVVFAAIEYDEADIGKTFTYTVAEKAGNAPGYTYDETKYTVVVKVEMKDGKLTPEYTVDGETGKAMTFKNAYAAKGAIVLEGTKVLEGRTLAADEFSFELKDANGNVLQTVTNDKDGNIVFKAIEYTEADLSKSPIKYTISEVKDSEIGMTYAANVAEVIVTLTDNGDGTIDAKADKTKDEIKFVNTYEEKVYEAKGAIVLEGTKVLEGRTLKAGEFTFEVKDAADKVVATGANDAAGKIVFTEIKYTEKDAGKTYTYKVYEVKGDLPGVTYVEEPVTVKVTVTDNGDGTLTAALTKDSPAISFKNTYEAEGAVTFKGAKFLLGREFKQGDEFTFELLNEKGDVIDTVTINPTSGTKADFAFKTIKYELADAGKTYTYTYRVKEKAGTEDGMTYDDTVHTVTVTVSDAGDGSLKVVASDSANKLNFTNTYLAEGSVLFSGTKTMNGKALVGKDFTFVLTDADGKEIETVTNDKDGKIVFSTIQYDLEDVGKTFTYKVSEKNDGKKAVTYDDTVYTVTVKVEDAGDGHLKVTASDNSTKLNFTNSYEAKAVLTMNAYKTVNGYKPSVDQVYDFVLLCDDGTEMTAQNKDENIIFGTLTFNEDDIGKTFIYTVKETTEANELLEVDTAIYQVAVTVVDNGDGNLKLETEFLKDGKRASGVVFANTATATLAISKTVKGPGPDKAFDLKVTFIGVDGKELEGVYDYDGDVKGTITSGGVIALKDGQSVTIVGLPEGATYTVEENAGPAYTVTVNGKPIAKAEGTLVGHGKLEFINTVETTTFSVTKVWEGMDLGEITLTLYADGKQITPQPEVTREGDKYTYYDLPKYNEEGEEIVYSAKERGIDGYIRIYNNVEPYQDVTSVVHDGGTIINREIQEEVHELSFKIRKVWTGVEATEEIPAITLTLYCNGEKLDVPTPKPNSEGWYKYYDLPKTVNGQIAVYTVVEEPIPGYTVTYKTASGEIVEEGVNGGEIINAKIPQTGDPATLGLWLALMGASAVLLTMLQRRRKA